MSQKPKKAAPPPLVPYRLHYLRSFITQFKFGEKELEEGTEKHWTAEDSTLVKLAKWKTEFPGESIKDIVFIETDPAKRLIRANLNQGEREGYNQFGQNWKEEWFEEPGLKKWSKMTEEHPNEENTWTRIKYGEYGEDKK